MKAKLIIAIVSFVTGLLVYHVFLAPVATKSFSTNDVATTPQCPGEKYLYDIGFTWTEQFWAENPNATDADWVVAWNSMLREVGCDAYQISEADVRYSSILADLIYASSTDEVTCPTEDQAPGVFEHWYNYYMRGSATSTDEGALEGWNDLMVRNGCTELAEPNI